MVFLNITNTMDNYSHTEERRSLGDCPIWKNKTDESLTLKLEVFDDESSDGGSSEALEIVTSENEVAESSSREHKREKKESSTNNDVPEIMSDMEEEIERQLDAKAAKSNLTVANVKNILKHVITNEHVLAMVRRTVKEDNDNMCDDTEEEFPYEPKLTRAKAKELLRTQSAIAWPLTPPKKHSASKCHVLIEQELSEDSSDEEYQPNDEEYQPNDEEPEQSDEESKFVASDMDVQHPVRNCPSSLKSLASNDCSTQTSWSEDGLFKIPQENIGQRTRSKLSLSDTPLETIEKAFVPPDITTDMYDSECDDEDWKDFLNNFTEPLTTDINDAFDDDEADPEYNILADEEQETVDKEELRVDRAVKVSRKELNLLVAELFDCTDMMSSDDEDIKTQHHESFMLPDRDESVQIEDPAPVTEDMLMETSDHSVGEEEFMLLSEQRLLLDQQMRKHVQLTTQHFLQTYAHPQLSHCASECKGTLVSLKCLGGTNTESAFIAANLPAALTLVEIWERKLNPSSPEASEIINFVQKEIDTAVLLWNKKRVYRCEFPPQFLELVGQSEVFLYPLLLPPQPFRCDGFTKPCFVPSEDSLIAIGLEQFEAYLKVTSQPPSTSKHKIKGLLIEVMNLVSMYMLPGRDPKQLYFHVRKARLINSNPIQYYFQHNRAPKTDHYVIPFTRDLVRSPMEQPRELLPGVWKEYLHPKKTKSQDGVTSLLLLHS